MPIRHLVVLCLLCLGASIADSARPVHQAGVVSTVFNSLTNSSLPAAIAESTNQGISWVELRQGSLGPPYEDVDQLPSPENIAKLVTAFYPHVSFGYAFVLPFMTDPQPNATFQSPLFEAALATAEAVRETTGSSAFLLRIVDLTTNNANFNKQLLPDIVASLDTMAVAVGVRGFRLAVENAKLDWNIFESIIEATPALFCFDPCNTLSLSNPDQPAVAQAAASSLNSSSVALLHAKQLVNGTVATTVTAGELDWSGQATAFNTNDYAGPILLEIQSSLAVWQDIADSLVYLQQAGFDFSADNSE